MARGFPAPGVFQKCLDQSPLPLLLEADPTVGYNLPASAPQVEQTMLHSVAATQQRCCLHIATTRCCQEAFPHGLNDGDEGYHRHRLGVITRAEKKDSPTLLDVALIIEVAPMTTPCFEQALYDLVGPAMTRGYPVAVFCLPCVRRVTHYKTTPVTT